MTTTRSTMPPQLENAAFLADTGENLSGAIRRLGYRNRDSLHRLCTRNGRPDIYTTLASREWTP